MGKEITLAEGDYFMVSRGFAMYRSSGFDSFITGSSAAPLYDRSHEGILYQVVQIELPMIIAKCVVVTPDALYFKKRLIGNLVVINTSEVEISPVSSLFVRIITEVMLAAIEEQESTKP